MARALRLCAAAVICLVPSLSDAQTPEPDRPATTSAGAGSGRPTVTAVRAPQPPTVDGRLDDPIWGASRGIDRFVQERPVEGAPATEQTEIHVAYDDERLYFGIYVHYSDPSLIRANRVDRDQTDNDDTVTFYIDPFLDQQRAYAFTVNGYGVQRDALLSAGTSGGSSGGGDTSWNTLFTSAGELVDDGWTAEIAIPFKSLRYPPKGQGESHRWGFQIEREIRTKNETVHWSPISRDVLGFLRQMGAIDGIRDLSTARNFEVMPTVTAIGVGNLNRTTGEYVTQDVKEAGVNFKYGITTNLVFDFTFNPDFSQIESDRQQIEVNQRFPVQYPELRPFFLEGREIYNVPSPGGATILHTRTIVDPRYGAKVAGKLGQTSISFLLADDESPGKSVTPGEAAFGQTAQTILGRVRYDYSGSHVGVLFTDREFLDSYSRLGGFDGRWQIGRDHRLSYKAFTTREHDLQGVDHTGELAEVVFAKEGGRFGYRSQSHMVDPDFGTEVGFVRRTDQRGTRAEVSYRWYPEGWIVDWGPALNANWLWDYEAVLQEQGVSPGVSVQFAKNVRANWDYDQGMERFNGIDFQKKRITFGGSVNTSRRVSFSGSYSTGDQIRYVTNPFLGSGTAWNTNVTLRPSSRLQAQITVNTSRFVEPRTGVEVFDVKIFRTQTTYQFTERFLIRNITQHNTFDNTLDLNLLFTYRVNGGTVFFVGYDDHYREGYQLNKDLFPTGDLQRTNRAAFAKLQYLFRYD
ncbi:MAG TPA: DUF5916 domain-containing protein [Vicinamibacterales bacterium]|jgi:hypothetical protein|nr:DUF5916 domain-containing protein [Vicinamibacterales bacterium]